MYGPNGCGNRGSANNGGVNNWGGEQRGQVQFTAPGAAGHEADPQAIPPPLRVVARLDLCRWLVPARSATHQPPVVRRTAWPPRATASLWWSFAGQAAVRAVHWHVERRLSRQEAVPRCVPAMSVLASLSALFALLWPGSGRMALAMLCRRGAAPRPRHGGSWRRARGNRNRPWGGKD